MKKNFKILGAICSIGLVAVIATTVNNNQNIEPSISYMQADYAINTDDPREQVGFADYYFVAKINQEIGTEYRHKVTIETENGFKTIGEPYTSYEVLVTENIKGELPTDTSINVTKSGGISEDGRFKIIYENDSLFEVGATYIIAATAQDDGTLLVSGPHSSEKIDTTRSLNEYKLHYDNEIIYDRQRSVFLNN